MKRIICKSGIQGWQSTLRKNYENSHAAFLAYDEVYHIAARLGFDSAEEAWQANPVIEGSVYPSDLRVSK